MVLTTTKEIQMVLINLKHTSRYQRRQEKFKDILPIPEIQSNPKEYFSLCSKTMPRLLKEIFYNHRRRNVFCISQEWLAHRCGVTRQYINRLLGELESLGVIKMWYRHKARSFYRVSSFFTDTIIASLSSLWRAWPLTMLMCNTPSNPAISKSRQLLNVNSFIYNPSLATPTYERDLLGVRACTKAIPPHSIDSSRSLKRKEEAVIQHHGARRMTFLPSQQRQLLNAISNPESTEPLFSDAIQSITSLNLTTFGKIKLLAFPDFVINKTEQEMKSAGNVRDPYGFFMKTAMRICQSSGIQPNWKWVNAIKEKLNLDDQTPTLVAAPERIPQKGTGKVNQSSGRGTGGFNPYEENMKLVRDNNNHMYQKLMLEKEANKANPQPKLSAHDEEWERTRIEDPVKFARWEKNAQMYREMMGLNPDGTFKPGRDPHTAVDALLGSFKVHS